MKNIIKVLAVAALAGTTSLFAQEEATHNYQESKVESLLDHLSLSANIAFDSEYVYRGAKKAQAVIQPTVELAYPVLDGKVYAGIWSVMPASGRSSYDSAKQVNPYIGFTYQVTDMFAADAGFIYYWNTGTSSTTAPSFRTNHTNRQRELYVGVSADVLLNPSVYAFYNIDLRQFVLQPSVAYSYDLGEFGLEGFSVDLAGHLGFLSAKANNGNQRPQSVKAHKNSYFYWCAKVDITYHFTENASISSGPRYAGNNDGFNQASTTAIGGGYNANALGNRKNMFWWGANASFKF